MYTGAKSVFASNSADIATTVDGVDIYNSKFLLNVGKHLNDLPTLPKREINTRLDVFCNMNNLENEDAIHYANKFIRWEDVPVKTDIKLIKSDQIKEYST